VFYSSNDLITHIVKINNQSPYQNLDVYIPLYLRSVIFNKTMKKISPSVFNVFAIISFILFFNFQSFAVAPGCATGLVPLNGGTIANPTTPFTWNAPTGTVTGYKFYLGTTSAANELLSAVAITGTSYTYTGALSCGTTYYWKVLPYNTTGNASGCAVQTFTIIAAGDPTIFPIGSWNAYCYNSTNFTNYTGYYTATGQDFNSTTSWNANYSPSAPSPNGATNYQGCSIPNDNHSVIYKRQGFTPGTYSLDILNDDGCFLYLNGNLIYSRASYTPTFITTVWTGNLDASSQIEFRWADTGGGGSDGAITFNSITTPTLIAGAISGDQTMCSGNDPLIFKSVTAGSGTCGPLAYQWQQDVGCVGGWSDIASATAATYDAPAITQTTCYRRAVVDPNCNRTAYTNTATVTITSVQQGNPSVFPLNTWNGYVYDFNVTGYTGTDDNWTDYKGYFSYAGTSSSDPGFYTSTGIYSATTPPSSAPGYAGCQVTYPLSGVQFKRQGFPTGTYQIDFDSDDAGYLYVNGVLVYGRTGCCTVVSNVWTGNLDATSKIEYRYKNNGGNGYGRLIMTIVTPTPIDGGTVASSASSTICSGDTPPAFTSTTLASGGCTKSGYQWQADAGSGFADIAAATNTTYGPTNVTVTTSYRRKYTDICGVSGYSNTLTLTVGTPTLPTPTFGSNLWNAYVYNFATTGYTGTDDNWTDYKGYFTYNGLSFNTGSIYGNSTTPSYAPGYYGCQVGQTLSGVQLKRQGFPTGTYQLDFNSDDAGYVYINGVQVFGRTGCCTAVSNIWTGNLDASSTIDFHYKNSGSSGYGILTFTLVTPTTPLDPGVIANNNSSTVCSGNSLPPFVSSTDATSGCYIYYQWELNTGSGFNSISGATAKTYTATNITAASGYRRKATDACGATAYSNTLSLTIATVSNTTPTFGSNTWNAYVYDFGATNPTGNGTYTANNTGWLTNSGTFQTAGISTSNPGFNTYTSLFAGTDPPSYAPGYQGCQVGNILNGVIFKRQGFPVATYQLDFTSDDPGYLFVNGVLVSSRASNGTNTNAWTGALNASSQVEFRYKNNGGSGGAILTMTVMNSTLPLVPAVIAANQTICEATAPAAFTTSTAATSGCTIFYQWQSSTSSATGPWTTISGATNTTYTSPVLTQTTYFSQAVTDGCGASGVSNAIKVTVNPLPLAAGTITGPTTFCPSQAGVAYSIPAVTNATGYTWTLPTGATIASGSGTNSITVNFATTSGTITVKPTNSCGNGATSSIAVSMTALPSAAGVFTTSTATTCAGQTGVVYTIAAVTGATSYAWTIPSDATITSASNTNSITVTFGLASGNVSVTPTNTCGTGTARTIAVTVINIPSAAGTMTGLSDICKPQTGLTYSIAAVTGATSYSWTVPSGVTITAGSTTRSITVNFTSTSVSGNIVVTPINSCGNGASTTYPVTVSSVPPGAASTISGPASACAGSIGLVYTVPTVTGATVYTWVVPTGTVITAGSNTSSITVNLGSTTGNFKVTPSNACGNGTISSAFNVTVNPYPGTAGTITGNTTLCGGTSQSYITAAVTNASTYNWALPTGSVITSGAGTRSIVVTMGTVSGNITVTPNNSCGDGTPSTIAVTINNPAAAAGAISGPTEVCKSATGIVYSIPAVTGATGYTWVLPSGTTITSGTNTNSITTSIGSNSGTISVTPTQSCGNGASASLAITISSSAPANAGTITGNASVCNGATSVTYSIGTVTRATIYNWTVPAGATITAGTGTTSITVTFGSTSGNVTVTPNNACGDGTGASKAVTVTTSPATVGAITGLTTVCKGQTGVTYSISAVAGATSYNWTVPTGVTITSGTGTNSIVTSYVGASATSGTVNVDAINACFTTSNSVAVTIDNACAYTWVGTISTDWNTASNWSQGVVPTNANSVVIPSGTPFAPTISASTSTAGGMTISTGATVTIAATGTLNVYGDYTNNGSVSVVAGSTVAFKGSTAQTVTGVSNLYNVQINNTAGVSIASALTVNGTISLLNGVLTTNSNVTVNFDNGGNIAYNVSDNGSISGNVTGSRAVIARTHYICAPFSGVTSAQVDATTPLFYNGYWKMYTKTFTNQGWAAIMDETTAMPLGTGFSLAYPNASSLKLTGTYDPSFSLTSPSYSNAAAGKYILIGNPYPSTINWSTIYSGGNAVNTGGAVYYWSATNNQVASWISPAGGTNGGSQFIPAMQAFMVATTGSGGNSSVVINNNARILSNSSFFRTAQADNATLKLYVKTADGVTDETLISLNSDATEEFEFDKDAYKIINSGLTPSLYTLTNGYSTMYSINSLPFNEGETIPLNLKVSKDGTYELHCNEFANLAGYTVLLEDKLNNTFATVDTALVYVIAAKTTDNTDRFVLRFRTNLTTSVSLGSSKSIMLSTYDNNLMLTSSGVTADAVEMKVYDAAGKLVQIISNQSIEPGVKIIPLDKLTSGIYLISFSVDGAPYTGKVILK
jgi:hypothetical protein